MEPVEMLNAEDDDQTLYRKMARMPLEQLEGEAHRHEKFARLARLINVFLMVKRQPPEMNVDLVRDENGWYLSFCDRLMLIDWDRFDRPGRVPHPEMDKVPIN